MRRPFSMLILCLLPIILLGQKNYRFDSWTTDDGLLNNVNYAIFQDVEGYIWIGGRGGLQRFDGHHFINFDYNRFFESNERIQNFTIRHITQSSDSTIWVGTEGGGIIRLKNGMFKDRLLPNLQDPNSISGVYVEDILQDSITGAMWIATDKGLDYLKGNSLLHYKHDSLDSTSLSSNTVYALFQDKKGRIWAGTRSGLNLHIGDGKFKQFVSVPNVESTITSNFIHGMTGDKEGNIWLALVEGGINKVDINSFEVTRYPFNTGANSLSHNIALDIENDPEGNIWVGTYGGGLSKLENGVFTNYLSDPKDPTSLTNNFVEELTVDNTGNIWTVHFFGGISRFSKSQFMTYRFSDYIIEDTNLMGTHGNMIIDRDDYLWMVTGAIFKIDFELNNILSITVDEEYASGLVTQRVLDILEDRTGKLWFASNGHGVYSLANGNVERFFKEENKSSLHNNRIFSLTEDMSGRIWMGSDREGISVFENGEFEYFFAKSNSPNTIVSNNINDLTCAPDSTIWIATDEGLSGYKNGIFNNYSLLTGQNGILPKDQILYVKVDNDNYVWLGYDGGVSRLNPSLNIVENYGLEDGLTDVIVEGLEVDIYGDIWLATHTGIFRFNEEINKFESIVTNYNLGDDAFLALIASRKKPEMIISGVKGIYRVNIDEITIQKRPINLTFTRFQTFGGATDSLNAGEVITSLNGSEFVIPYDNNNFEIHFSAMNYLDAAKINYFFKLEGLDDTFVNLGNDPTIRYTSVPPGKYKLIAEASFGYNERSIKQLGTIKVLSPWWMSSLFLIFIIILSAVLIYWVIYFRTKALKRTKDLLAQKVKEGIQEIENQKMTLQEKNKQLEESIENLHETQNQLVQAEKMAALGVLSAGVAHEINNPLNLIKNGVKLVKEEISRTSENDENVEKFMELINNGLSRATTIVKSLSHLSRKGEKLNEICSIPIIIENCLVVLRSNLKDHVEVVKDFPEQIPSILGSEGKLHQAFLNILSNAEQAIEGRGQIKIYIHAEKDVLLIEISDTGKGIPYKEIAKVADPFFTTKPPGKGTGLGLSITYTIIEEHKGTIVIDSEEHEGTNVIVSLPIHKDIQGENE